MKNTLENKAKFFAQYWGQKVFIESENVKFPMQILGIDTDLGVHVYDSGIKLRSYYSIISSLLQLKPLSSITDEDACYISMLLVNWQESMSNLKPENIKVRGRIDGDHVWDELVMEFVGSFKYTVRYRGGDFMTWIDGKYRCEWNTYNHLKVYDFLRSKGYALPWMELSVEKLQEYGWINLKQKQDIT